jgi:hypothetical protein
VLYTPIAYSSSATAVAAIVADIPDDLAACIKAIGPLTTDNIQQQVACEARYPTNYHNSMLALDLDTGAVK